jgi:hypothetical protein
MPPMESHIPPPDANPADEPQIDTPVIDIQDLEHRPGPDTRVNNAGVNALPQLDLSQDDEKARRAIEEFERMFKDRPPG